MDIQNLIQKALVLHQSGKLKEAESIYETILKKQPDNADALHLSALVAQQSGSNDKAIKLYEHLLSVYPDVPEFQNSCGAYYATLKKFDLALNCFNKAISINPKFANAYNNLGNVFKELGKTDDAITNYRKAISINTNYADAYKNLGVLLKDMGQLNDAIDNFEKAVAINPNYIEAYNFQGNALDDLGRMEDAIQCYEKALAINPEFAKSHNNMGIAYYKLGQEEKALECYEKALAINPEYTETLNNMGNVYRDMTREDDAISCFEKALAINPDFAQAHINLGNVYKDREQPDEAIACYEKALNINPNFAEAYHNMGTAITLLPNSRELDVVDCYLKALAIDPDNADTHLSLGNTYSNLGRTKEALEHFEEALRINPDCYEAQQQKMFIEPEPDDIPIIEKWLKGSETSEDDLITCHFTLGNLYAKKKSFSKSFDHYLIANSLKRKSIIYNAVNNTNEVNRLIKVYSKEYFQGLKFNNVNTNLPVFILGMPRSGTSLVEQILSSHPNVYGAGELLTINNIKDGITTEFKFLGQYPECMTTCNQDSLIKYSEKYLEELNKHTTDAKRVTDKLPGNVFNIGLIKTLFPHAPIIHCNRNPLDNCTSIFLTRLNNSHGYSCDLVELGKYYLDYQRLVTHWRSIFSSEIFEVQYEELVSNQEEVSKQLIEYIGLDWDQKCMDFHTNERTVRTASNLQVRKPMYKGSIDRWKRYEKQLQPLIDALQ